MRKTEKRISVRTEPAGTTAEGELYRAVFPHPTRKGREASLLFTVSPNGALVYDNRQPDARLCERRGVSLALAEAMTRAARVQVPGAQAERTLHGTARELRIHSRAYALGVKRSHSVTAELGSPAPDAPDFDDNAIWFERPLRSLPRILKALFKK